MLDAVLLGEQFGQGLVDAGLREGVDRQAFADATAAGTVDRDIPTNHSPFYAPVLQPTLDNGVQNLVVAAREWLGERAS